MDPKDRMPATDQVPPAVWAMGVEAFECRMPHHDGIKVLWETKWKAPCERGVYPFHDGQYVDFAPIFELLIRNNVNDAWSEEYTKAFTDVARTLSDQGDERVLSKQDTDAARDFYLRAAAVLRIARFPYITQIPEVNNAAKWAAWEEQKRVYAKVGRLWSNPLQEVDVPFSFRRAGDQDRPIPAYVRRPQGDGPFPTVVLLTGLDGYRPDNTVRCNEFLSRGWASVVVEIPGTADCPADPKDPESPERMWNSILGWMEKEGHFDMAKIMVWGLSSGGYYAARMAYTHHDRFLGVVSQGAGIHWFFDAAWLDKADGHEYPFGLTECLAPKFGFDSVQEFKDQSKAKFSLLDTGILNQPCTRLLMVNGTLDGLMPIEDSQMLESRGADGVFVPGRLHMGYPEANLSVYPWMEKVMTGNK